MKLTYPRNPAQGADYSDFCALLERLYLEKLQEPTDIEINPVDEYRVNGWFFSSDEELKQTLHLKALANPTTGKIMLLMRSMQVGLGIVRFLDADGEPLALLELYPLAGEALARSKA